MKSVAPNPLKHLTDWRASCSPSLSVASSTVSFRMTWLRSRLCPTRRWGRDWKPPSRTWRPSPTSSCRPSSSRWTKSRTSLTHRVAVCADEPAVCFLCLTLERLSLSVRYGMRFISKVLKDTLHEKFPDATEDELLKVCIFNVCSTVLRWENCETLLFTGHFSGSSFFPLVFLLTLLSLFLTWIFPLFFLLFPPWRPAAASLSGWRCPPSLCLLTLRRVVHLFWLSSFFPARAVCAHTFNSFPSFCSSTCNTLEPKLKMPIKM